MISVLIRDIADTHEAGGVMRAAAEWLSTVYPVSMPDLASMTELRFQEELHAIQAAIDGQGNAICSNILVEPELTQGALLPVSKITLPGYAFYAAYRFSNSKKNAIEAFVDWTCRAIGRP